MPISTPTPHLGLWLGGVVSLSPATIPALHAPCQTLPRKRTSAVGCSLKVRAGMSGGCLGGGFDHVDGSMKHRESRPHITFHGHTPGHHILWNGPLL